MSNDALKNSTVPLRVRDIETPSDKVLADIRGVSNKTTSCNCVADSLVLVAMSNHRL
jgi:hypothetical protein